MDTHLYAHMLVKVDAFCVYSDMQHVNAQSGIEMYHTKKKCSLFI